MAKKVLTVDDVDGYDGDDVTKRDFEVGGANFTIDLGDANYGKLQGLLESLAPFLEAATPAGRVRKSSSDGDPKLGGHTNADVRRWAKEEDVEVSARGKIAEEVYEKFIAAHPDPKPQD